MTYTEEISAQNCIVNRNVLAGLKGSRSGLSPKIHQLYDSTM